jgi:hypothetical protein
LFWHGKEFNSLNEKIEDRDSEKNQNGYLGNEKLNKQTNKLNGKHQQ